MRHARLIPWLVGAVAVSAGWGSPQKTEKPSDLALKDKGLPKVGTVYTLEDEKPVLARMKDARTAYNALAAMSSQLSGHQELAQRASQLADQHTELQEQINEINQQIGDSTGGQNQAMGSGGPGGGGGGPGGGGGGPGGGMGGMMGNRGGAVSPLTIERDQLKSVLAEVNASQKTLKNQMPQAKDTKALEARVKTAEESLKAILEELRGQVDAVTKKYADLAADATVQKALIEAKQGNPKLRLGPSDAFNAGVKELVKSEQQILGKRTLTVSKAASKKKTKAKK